MDLRGSLFSKPVAMVTGLAMMVLVPLLSGCQVPQSVSVSGLIAHQAMIDFSGLAKPKTLEQLKIAASVPQHWEALPLQRNALYTHQQWRSPSHSTGVGVAYIHMPIPVSAKTIIWFAKMQYAQNTNGKPQGQLIGQWTDAQGREWFEAQNAKFHVKGYAVTSGFDAWIVYDGYRRHDPLNPVDIGMAARSMDSVLPAPLVNADQSRMETASRE